MKHDTVLSSGQRISLYSILLSVLLMMGFTACRDDSGGSGPGEAELDAAILGALAYLDDTQIRDRPGRRDCRFDASEIGEGCESILDIPPQFSALPYPGTETVRNRQGEWAVFIYHVPDSIAKAGLPPLRTQDSTLITSAITAYPLFLFTEENEPQAFRPTETMLGLSVRNIVGFRRGDSYSFWPRTTLENLTGIVGPYNINMDAVRTLADLFLNDPSNPFIQNLFDESVLNRIGVWISTCMTDSNNTTGVYALFNIPDDADDTAAAAATFRLYVLAGKTDTLVPDSRFIEIVARFRDLNRTKEDERNTFKPPESGAYLTWLKDENAPYFADPSTGVIPLGVNNVDAAVNANVLFALALNGRTDLPGYEAAAHLLANVIHEHTWPAASLYYLPQRMMFPYTVTRAWRDGGARIPALTEAMPRLLQDLLDEQRADGSFDGGEDRTTDLSTALAATALINLGESVAEAAGRLPEYRRALQAAVTYLLQAKKPHPFLNPESTFGPRRPPAFSWQEGLFFSASASGLAHWRSEPLTVAMVLETLVKYRLGYQYGTGTLPESGRLRLLAPDTNGTDWHLQPEKSTF